mmetsp:Transcript_7891/g.18887  ORF Transcript_7891/g.18887 Transcript_7891/m.18887 type:complete len:87 (+) Transcript_7891:977-1237(+)
MGSKTCLMALWACSAARTQARCWYEFPSSFASSDITTGAAVGVIQIYVVPSFSCTEGELLRVEFSRFVNQIFGTTLLVGFLRARTY